jgi:hypothetical protein
VTRIIGNAGYIYAPSDGESNLVPYFLTSDMCSHLCVPDIDQIDFPEVCENIYSVDGQTGVLHFIKFYVHEDDIEYSWCTQCDFDESPFELDSDECLVCGSISYIRGQELERAEAIAHEKRLDEMFDLSTPIC